MNSKKLVTTARGETYLHKKLCRVVDRQIKHAADSPRGSFYDHLVSMVFAFNALEAYLNYVGGKLAPETWKDERNFFRKEPYRGFEGKIRKVHELAGLAEPSKRIRPYATIWKLKDLRDLIAHGKTEFIDTTYVHDEIDDLPLLLPTVLDEIVTPTNASQAKEDVETIAQGIHDAAHPKVKDLWFGTHAFGGALRQNSRSTELEP